MGFDFTQLPADYDFSAWKAPISEKIDKYCGGYEFTRNNLKWGQGIFSSLSDSTTTDRMYSYLDPEQSDGLSGWTNRQWWMIFIFVIGVIVLLWTIYLACKITWSGKKGTPRVGFAYKSFFHKSIDQGKPTPKEQPVKMFNIITMIVTVLGLLFTTFTIVANSQMVMGLNEANCNLWLQVYGHYYGASELTSSEKLGAPVSSNWRGTYSLKNQLINLQPKLKPGEDNELYILFTKGKEAVTNNVKNAHTQIATSLTKLAGDWSEELDQIADQISRSFSDVGVTSIGENRYAQGRFVDLLTTWTAAVNQGAAAMDQLVEKYAGPNSAMMNGAYTAAVDAQNITSQIDVSVSHIVTKWEKLSKKLGGAVLTSAVFGFVSASLVVFALVVLCWVATSVKGKYTRNEVVKDHRKTWVGVYWVLAVSGGLMLTLTGLNLLVGGLGASICEIGDNHLFSSGRWGILGEEVLFPMGEETTIDMTAVFDTCVKETGRGDVSSVLGLDLRIDELKNDIDEALATVLASKEAILSTRSKTSELKEIKYYIEHHPLEITKGGGEAFADLINMQFIDVDNTDLQPSVVYGFTAAAATLDLMSRTFFAEKFSIKRGYENLNALVDMVNEYLTTNLPEVAHLPHYCSKKAIENGSNCGEYEDSFEITSGLKLTDFVGHGAPLVSAFSDGWRYQDYTNNYGTRFQACLAYYAAVETMFSMIGTSTSCGGTPLIDCQKDLKDRGVTEYQNIRTNTEAIMQFVNEFVGVTVVPTMEELGGVADNLVYDSNCQFEGTALRQGVVGSLCEVLFPGAALASIWSVFTGFLLLIAAYVTRYWMHLSRFAADTTVVDPSAATPPPSPGFQYLTTPEEPSRETATRAVTPVTNDEMDMAKPEVVASPLTIDNENSFVEP